MRLQSISSRRERRAQIKHFTRRHDTFLLTDMSDNTPNIDWEQLDMIADGYTEDFVEIYHEFELDLPSILNTLEAALSAGDPVAVFRAAHQAKGSAANFGLKGFSGIMASIEHGAKGGSIDGAADALKAARETFHASIAAVKSERGI